MGSRESIDEIQRELQESFERAEESQDVAVVSQYIGVVGGPPVTTVLTTTEPVSTSAGMTTELVLTTVGLTTEPVVRHVETTAEMTTENAPVTTTITEPPD